MSAISPDVQAVLEQMNTSMPTPADFDVAAFRAMVEDHPAPPSSIALAAIDDTIIPGDPPVPARWYRPNLDATQPAILFIHGGGFIQRGLDSHDEMCRRLATGTNTVVVALDCRPAPEHPYPAAVDDTYAAVNHITNQADALGLDASRIALAGISSGAAIAAGTALRCRDAGGPHVALQILLTPMLRHRETTPSRHTYGHGDYGITTALLDWYSDQYAPGTTAEDPYCAPLRATDLRNLPPAYIHTAGLDPLRDDGIDYAQRLQHAHVTVEHHDAAGLFHGFHFFTDTLPQAHRQVAAEMEAIRRLLDGRPTRSVA
jgi:acetyl esterase